MIIRLLLPLGIVLIFFQIGGLALLLAAKDGSISLPEVTWLGAQVGIILLSEGLRMAFATVATMIAIVIIYIWVFRGR